MRHIISKSLEFFRLHKARLIDIFIMILAIGSLIRESSFSFNPIFLACLFLIYYRGILSLGIFFILSFALTFFKGYLYGLEIVLISSTYLLINYLIHKIKPDKKIKYLALIIVDSFLLFLYLRRDFSYSSIINACLFVAIEFIVIISITKSLDYIIYKKNYDSISMSIFLVSLSLSFMFVGSLGLIIYHLVAFFVIYYLPKYEKISFLFVSALSMSFLLYYSLEAIFLILVPLLFMGLVKDKFKLISYVIPHITLSLLYQVHVLYNVHFYIGLISIIIFILIPKEMLSRTSSIIIIKPECKRQENEKIENYLNVVSKALEGNQINNSSNYEAYIQKEHCDQCDHNKYCKIKTKLSDYVKTKLTKSSKKEIEALCLLPSRLTFALQEGYSSYRQESLIKEQSNRQIEQLKETIEAIKKPLQEKKDKPSLKECFLDYGLDIFHYEEGDDKLVICIDKKSYSNFPITINEIVKKYDIHYNLKSSRYDALTSNVVLGYEKMEKKQVEIGEFSKAHISEHNGDNYKIFNLEDNLEIILCDGMGNGEKAERNSKYLLESFSNSLNVHQNYKEAIDDVNRLLRIKSPNDQFSTLDFAELDLRTLVLTMVKAGAYASFLLRNGKIKMIPNNSLPLGIIDEVNINPVRYQLQSGDILMIMSDGLGELFEKYKNIIDYNIDSSLGLTRHIFEVISSHQEIKDDATNIVIKIL